MCAWSDAPASSGTWKFEFCLASQSGKNLGSNIFHFFNVKKESSRAPGRIWTAIYRVGSKAGRLVGGVDAWSNAKELSCLREERLRIIY